MLWPSRIAWIAASTTGCGGSVSHTPCARLMPPTSAQATVMARISDCTRPGESSLRRRLDDAAINGADIEKRRAEARPSIVLKLASRGSVAALNHVQQPQDDNDEQDRPQAARRIVAPTTRVRIGREGRKHQHQQNDDQNKHGRASEGGALQLSAADRCGTTTRSYLVPSEELRHDAEQRDGLADALMERRVPGRHPAEPPRKAGERCF